MRTIKFRGKRKDNGEWVYGNLIKYYDGSCCIVKTDHEDDAVYFEVDPETVGQVTGLHDKDGNEIYEADILLYMKYDRIVPQVEFITVSVPEIYLFNNLDCEVCDLELVGNAIDNPELLNTENP